jgi:hypothetical protein
VNTAQPAVDQIRQPASQDHRGSFVDLPGAVGDGMSHRPSRLRLTVDFGVFAGRYTEDAGDRGPCFTFVSDDGWRFHGPLSSVYAIVTR